MILYVSPGAVPQCRIRPPARIFLDSDMDRSQSSPELAAEIVEEAERLIRLEIELAKAELKELAITNAIAAGAFAGAAGLALLGRSKLHIGIPERTVNSFKETKDWALRQMRSPGR